MAARVAINGFGRIGRLACRCLLDGDFPGLRLVQVNDPGGAAMAAHLLAFDTVQGSWDREIEGNGDSLTIDGREIAFSAVGDPAELAWRDRAVDLVIEASGTLTKRTGLQAHLDAGAKAVAVAAPVKDGDDVLNVVMGCNDDAYEPARHSIVTAASCTTNSLAPVVGPLHRALGIRHGQITTVHAPTNTQNVVDAPHKDPRRARSALNALIPTSTGSAAAIGWIYPELAGKLNGIAVRVPLLGASLTDAVFEVSEPTTRERVNTILRQAAEAGPLAGILGYEARPLVSADFVGDPRSAIVDAFSTTVVDDTQVKIYAWYDNEWGYANRLIELADLVARTTA